VPCPRVADDRLPARPMMKIAVLQPSYADSCSPTRAVDIPKQDFSLLLPEHQVEHLFLDKATCVEVVRRSDADLFINLCDGALDEDTPGIEVVELLERENRAFTGAGTAFYDPTRQQMKEACQREGVRTAQHVFARDERGVEEALARLRLPCFVKPEHGHGSDGIEPSSRVTSAGELRAQAAKIIRTFGGTLIEEYIPGRELTVLIATNPEDEAAPLLYRPVECLLDPAVPFKTFDYKWRDSVNAWIPCTDEALVAELQAMTRTMFLALGGNGYARTDVRMDPEGRLFFIEINPNCAIFYPDDNGGTADIILAYDGGQKLRFLRTMIRHALLRQRRNRAVQP
jgi:D-alanine-D-alanine ligase